ncbi:MAG: nicotinate (nicotinamide) nucleotide adenylyltransferase [Acutalibacter sp.]|nr:nicotinate (nicotinamide) nucleotide adenylyltransferase [Acutalibacter sp.]
MKIGIYGGTFNPIHLGHLHILQEFIRRLKLSKVLLIPTHVPPHKQSHNLASGEERVTMCKIAAAEITEATVEVSTIELEREGKSYTAETLQELTRQYPHDEFYLLMGEDMFLTIHQWYQPETIFSLATVCGSPRSEDGLQKLYRQRDFLEKEYGARCIVEDISYFPASSTEVRELARRGESLSHLVPGAVENYIKAHGLYGESDRGYRS